MTTIKVRSASAETSPIGLAKDMDSAMDWTNSGTPYWVYVSRIQHPEKNHIRLIEAYELLYREDRFVPHLVCVGGDWFGAEEVHERHGRSPACDRIHFTGFMEEDDVADVVARANLYVYPSLLEEYGPIIEAMALGVPVACSHMSVLPLGASEAAMQFDPTNPEEIARTLACLAFDAERRRDLVERGLRQSTDYMWRVCAELTLEELCRTDS